MLPATNLDDATKKQLLAHFQQLFGAALQQPNGAPGISLVDVSALLSGRGAMIPAAALAHFITILGLAQVLTRQQFTPSQVETILVGLFSPKALEWGKAALVEFPAMVKDEAEAIQGAIRGDGSFDVRYYRHISEKLNVDGIKRAMKEAAATPQAEPKQV